MKSWVVVTDSKVVGTRVSSDIPAPREGTEHIEVQSLDEVKAQMDQASRQGDAVLYDAETGFSVPVDKRPLYRVTTETVGVVGMPHAIRLEVITAGNVDTKITARRIVPFEGRRFAFDFVDGVADRAINFAASGFFEISDSTAARIETPVRIEVIE